MKIKLKEKFGVSMEEGSTQSFFGVPFKNENKKIGDNQVLSEWFADVEDVDGYLMDSCGRVDIIAVTASEQPKKQGRPFKG